MEGSILDLGGSSELFSVVVVYRTTRVAESSQVPVENLNQLIIYNIMP